MKITEITDNDDNMTLCNTTNDDNDILNIDITYLFLLIISIPCFLSIICCLSLSICSFIKIFKKNKKMNTNM